MPGNPNPRNLTQLVEAGAMDDAVDLRQRGYSGQRLRDKLARLFPRAFVGSIRALADRSIAVVQAVRALLALPKTADVSNVDIPLVEGAPPGISATYAVPLVPEGAARPATIHTQIVDAGRLTVGELDAMGAERLSGFETHAAAGYERFEKWLDRQRRLAEQGDPEAADRLARLRQRLDPQQAKLTVLMRGR